MVLVLFKCFVRSDDGEREDSDNDNPVSPKKTERGATMAREHVDTVDKARMLEIAQKMYGNASPARAARSIKKVDMGAAANYGKEQSSVNIQTFSFFFSGENFSWKIFEKFTKNFKNWFDKLKNSLNFSGNEKLYPNTKKSQLM